MEKMALPWLNKQLVHLHGNNANMTAEESELEFLKVINFISPYEHIHIQVF